MTSYNIQILLCKKCNNKFSFWDIASCNTFGAIFFTDGSVIGPMYDQGQNVIECPHCGHLFFHDEKHLIDEMRDSEYFENGEQSKLKTCLRPSYMKAVSHEIWRTISEEKIIRIRAWHEYNKMILVSGHRPDENDRDAVRSNLKALILILNEDQDEELLMKAEALRHLSEFKKAIAVLNRRSVLVENKNRYDLILKLAMAENSCVKRIPN